MLVRMDSSEVREATSVLLRHSHLSTTSTTEMYMIVLLLLAMRGEL